MDDESKPKVSESAAELSAVVKLPIQIKTVRWEIFGTPEYTGGVPGPTDYVTLVAELQPQETDWFEKYTDGTAEEYVAPEAARSWLAVPFQILLKNFRNSNITLPYRNECRALRASLTKTGAPVSGFVCRAEGKALVYLTLSAAT